LARSQNSLPIENTLFKKGVSGMTTKTEPITPSKRVEKKRHEFWYDLFRRMILEKPLGTLGLFIAVVLY